MTAPLMGNLALKSSTLAPVSSKLSTQYLVADHMINHYSKIEKAAAAVDCTSPKCLNTSQKLRDRRTRDEIMNNSQLYLVTDSQPIIYRDTDSQPIIYRDTDSQPIIYRDTFSNVHEYVTENLQYSQNTNTVMHRPTLQSEARGYVHTQTWPTLQSEASGAYVHKQTWPVVSRDILSSHVARTYAGDLLDRRRHLFTQPMTPFIPRTHKNNHESILRRSRCYNPPRINHGSGNNIKQGSGNNTKDARDDTDSHHASKSDINKILFLSQRGGSDRGVTRAAPPVPAVRSNQGAGHKVPALAIPVDSDHAKWLKEQANKASLRMHDQANKSRHETFPLGARVTSRDNGMRDTIKMEDKKRTEDNMYLSFAKEVTDDILSRGITSDSVLHRVFANQLERRKHDLDVNRMKSIIRDLCKRIGVEEPAQHVQPVASLVASDYRNKINQQNLHHNSQHIQDQHHHVKDGRHSQRSGDSSFQDASRISGVRDASSISGVSKASNSQDVACVTNDCTASSSLQSTSTLKFGLTTNLFSTVTSEAEPDKHEDADLEKHAADLEKHAADLEKHAADIGNQEALKDRKEDDCVKLDEEDDSVKLDEEDDCVKLDEDDDNVGDESEVALTQALKDRLDDSSNLDNDIDSKNVEDDSDSKNVDDDSDSKNVDDDSDSKNVDDDSDSKNVDDDSTNLDNDSDKTDRSSK